MVKNPRDLVKKSETIRERADKQANAAPKTHRLRNTAGKPVGLASKVIKAVTKPFSFVLVPFKTRPVRFVGRVISKVLGLGYFRGSFQELRQVQWPGRKETTKLTTAVFIFAVVFSIIVALTDLGLDKVFRKVLVK